MKRPEEGALHFFSLCCLQAVGITLRSLIQSVDEILPSLHSSVTTEVNFRRLRLIYGFKALSRYLFVTRTMDKIDKKKVLK